MTVNFEPGVHRNQHKVCMQARNQVCFYADDDWDPFDYFPSFYLAFLRNPCMVHTMTDAFTWYNNVFEWQYETTREEVIA